MQITFCKTASGEESTLCVHTFIGAGGGGDASASGCGCFCFCGVRRVTSNEISRFMG